MRYVRGATREAWLQAWPGTGVPAQRQVDRREVLRFMQKMTVTMQRANAPILAAAPFFLARPRPARLARHWETGTACRGWGASIASR